MKETDQGVNPYDPENPFYESPSFTIKQAPDEGATVTDDMVTIAWQGNQSDLQYSYRYKEARQSVWVGWTQWASLSSITLGPLDEQAYNFELRGKYPGESGAIGDPFSLNFTVNAVTGPAILLYPRQVRVSSGQSFTLDVIAEEVSDLLVADFKLNWPAGRLSLQQPPQEGDLVSEDNMILLTKPDNALEANTNGSLNISMGLVNQSAGFNSSGVICRLTFKATSSGSIGINSAALRDYSNQPITLSTKGSSEITVE